MNLILKTMFDYKIDWRFLYNVMDAIIRDYCSRNNIVYSKANIDNIFMHNYEVDSV